MKWSNLVSLTLLSYLVSMSVHAQPDDITITPGNAPQQASTSNPDNMTIVDTGGSLKIVPKGQQPTASSPTQPGQMMGSPPQGGSGQPSADSVDMNPNPPQGELQEPSNSNQSMMPVSPQQNSMPNPDQGSLQN